MPCNTLFIVGGQIQSRQKEKDCRAAQRARENIVAGPSEGENALWCWRAQKSTSFRKIFSDHFASRGGLYYSQEVDTVISPI